MEERIIVQMTEQYLFDFTLYHTYSKFSGFLTNILGLAIAFMGIIMFIAGKTELSRVPFYLLAAEGLLQRIHGGAVSFQICTRSLCPRRQ